MFRLQPDVVEQLGDVSYLHGVTSGGAELVVQLSERLPSLPQTELMLAFYTSRAFLFDSAGRRIR